MEPKKKNPHAVAHPDNPRSMPRRLLTDPCHCGHSSATHDPICYQPGCNCRHFSRKGGDACDCGAIGLHSRYLCSAKEA
jgi:hypothetical protein